LIGERKIKMQIKISDRMYDVIDVLSNISIADSSVVKRHKIGSGNGERKIYLSGNIEERISFFDNFEKDIKGFVYKQNLLDYLEMARIEYKNPTHEYLGKDNMPNEYDNLVKSIRDREDILKFDVKKSDVTHSGIYINQNSGNKIDKNWNLIGNIALPRISRLSILKLELDRENIYYFKISFGLAETDPIRNEIEIRESIEKIEQSKLKPTEKEAVILARIGQGTYRKNLLEETNVCPFTLVDDEHLLIASHIKPWKQSTNKEKKDPKNGFVFTPTYDKLFDRGYISFTDDKRLMVSPWLSKYNCECLGLVDGMLVEKLPAIDSHRKIYLAYHRANILKKLEDL
jgi:hypothetical protein